MPGRGAGDGPLPDPKLQVRESLLEAGVVDLPKSLELFEAAGTRLGEDLRDLPLRLRVTVEHPSARPRQLLSGSEVRPKEEAVQQ